MKDPLFLEIVDRLDGPLVAAEFEACACDLLQQAYPTLSPVEGGSDAGMDAAIDDGHGEPFPVVITTNRRPIRNLTRSLDSYVAAGKPRRKVILATSARITPQQRRNLERRAEEKGFHLAQVFPSSWFAQQLYRRPEWREELLRISGVPAALSAVPSSSRPFVEIELVGREADLAWLRSSTGNRVLVGEPGSGKTFLLHRLVDDGRALFLESEDDGAIADAYRRLEPEIVIVDDAHVDPSRIIRLRRLRKQIGGEFSILAVTWPGSREEVTEALGGVAEKQIRPLELLARDEILRVYQLAGVRGRDNVMRELVDQASGKPGLAVTIATWVLQGAWHDVVTGEVLRKNLLTVLRRLIGEEVEEILAAVAVGGHCGMTLDVVAGYLAIPPGEVRRKTADLAFAGVLASGEGGRLAVEPPALRAALLRLVFFSSSPHSLDPTELLQRAPSLPSATLALLEAAARGGAVPDVLLRELVEAASDQSFGAREVWQAYASLGKDQARWVLDNFPGALEDIARPALNRAPEETLTRLLLRAERAAGPLHSQPDHPLRLLSDWLEMLTVSDEETEEALDRRRLAVCTAVRHRQSGGSRRVVQHAVFLALSPSVKESSPHPGSGDRLTIRPGLLRLSGLRRIATIWEDARGLIDDLDADSWPLFHEFIWSWIYPRYAAKGGTLEPEAERVMHSFAEHVLRELEPLSRESPGLAAGLQRLYSRLPAATPIVFIGRDRDFEVLFPSPEDYRTDPRSCSMELERLAAVWAARAPAEIAVKLARFATERSRIGHAYPRLVEEFIRLLCQKVESAALWWAAFKAVAPSDLSFPFLRLLVERREQGWSDSLLAALGTDQWSDRTTALLLSIPEPPSELLETALEGALEKAAQSPWQIESLCLRRCVPVPQMKSLLSHSSWVTALAAALGEWMAEDGKGVRPELAACWRAAILHSRTQDYPEGRAMITFETSLGDLLYSEPGLALDWLRHRFRDPDLPSRLEADGAFTAAVDALGSTERATLLGELDPHPLLYRLIPLLVGDDPDVLRCFLRREPLARYRPFALQGVPGGAWINKARVACEEGLAPEEVASAVSLGINDYEGDERRYWADWRPLFSELAADDDPRLRAIGESGKRLAESMKTELT